MMETKPDMMETKPDPNQFKNFSIVDDGPPGSEVLKRLKGLKERYFEAKLNKKQVCIERAWWVTKYLRDEADPSDAPIVRYAKAVRYFLCNKKALFFDENDNLLNLLPGTTTSKYLGVPVYPELIGLPVWPELDTISTRDPNPQILDPEDAKKLALDIFPFWMERNIVELTRKEYHDPPCLDLFEKLVFFIASKAGAISHTVPCYEKVLARGIQAIIDEAKTKQAELERKGALDRQGLDFYRAVQIALDGVLLYAEALAKKAESLGQGEKDAGRKRDFYEMARICRKVPRYPAETFHEALSALWLAQVAVHAENINLAISPGRVDQILYPYYKTDKEHGTLTDERALELAGCFWLKLNDNTYLVPQAGEKLFGGAGTAPAVTLGGVRRDNGKDPVDAVNELTYLFLRATEMLVLRDPNVNARYHYEVNGDEYLERVSEVIANTKAIPAFHNDVVDIQTLMHQGVSEADARDYAIIGCVELASAGRSYDAPSSIILNLIAPLEMALYDGKRPITGLDNQIGPHTGDPSSFETFSDFWKAFTSQLDFLIDQAVTLNNYFGTIHQKALPTPLLSAFFEGPMGTGTDLIFGGATYNSSGATHVGFADTVDSLNAIEQGIFVDQKCSFGELLQALKGDFKEHKGLHAYLREKAPKYGTDHAIAKKNARNLVSHLYATYHSRMNYRGGRYRPAYWTMTNHAGQGELAGALPNGRRKGKVLASGITPVSQAARNLAVCLESVAALDANQIPGGEAFNLKFSNLKEHEDLKRFSAHVKTYFQKGGMQVQFNIMDYDMLIEARKHPDQHPDLIVRVSGYSAYFNDLTDDMKKEIITRTAYDIHTDRAAAYPPEAEELLPYESGPQVPALSGTNPGPQVRAWSGGGPMWNRIVNFFLLRSSRFKRIERKLVGRIKRLDAQATKELTEVLPKELTKELPEELTEELFTLLLRGMELAFYIEPQFRRNLDGFKAQYLFVFKTERGLMNTAVTYKNSRMSVSRKPPPNPNVTVNFADYKAVFNFLTHPADLDVVDQMLKQKLDITGNLNYIYKFGYMARHLLYKLGIVH